MQRSVMKQGPSTLVVSLPSKWVKKHSIKKGSSLFLAEDGNALKIQHQKTSESKSISIDLSNTLPMTHRFVGALYMAGFDEMNLTYSCAEEAEQILETLKTLTGHEVFKNRNKVITIKKIVEHDANTFPQIYRKCFHVLEDMAEDTAKALQENNKDLMKEVILKDDALGIFVDYARRLSLMNIEENSAEKYHIAVQLEKIADRFKYICRLYQGEQPNELISSLIQELSQYIKALQDLFYAFTPKKIVDFGKRRKELQTLIKTKAKDIPNNEFIALSHCSSILDTTFDLNGTLLALNLSRNSAHIFK